eukprot:CAMPEP_0172804640 /NCGR_PEP_ID=MMETSP1075-20121228/5310_1 /TAXON_ID=2916 /ORGANISM="Ceratium fusus, Strain PA161109" /LENGTH=443 /DNA_ID=CAMNT_0013643257 /DNA_START=25 /DNA_END=1357 /DNA_ORIENTATION=+
MAHLGQMLVGSCCARTSREEAALEDEFGEQVLLPKQAALRGAHSPIETSKEDFSPNTIKSYKVHADIFPEEVQNCSTISTIRTVRADVMRACDAKATRMTTSQYVSSLTTVSIALMIYIYEAATYNLIFLGRILPARGKEVLVVPFMVVFNVLWGLALWSYLQAHWSDPGAIPQRWQDFALSLGDALPVAPARLEWQPGKATWCKKCSIPRPERAHHCHICGICVLRMDHHCPYIFNCVGFNNHKHFLLLVLYSSLTCVTALVTSAPELIYCSAAVLHADHDGAKRLQTSEIIGFLIFGLLALFLTFLVTPMVPAHLMLAARNQTSIEGNYTNMPNPFDRGSCAANIAEVFGSYGPDWFIPMRPTRPLGDGVSFVRNDESDTSLLAQGDAGLSEDLEAIGASVTMSGFLVQLPSRSMEAPLTSLHSCGDARAAQEGLPPTTMV